MGKPARSSLSSKDRDRFIRQYKNTGGARWRSNEYGETFAGMMTSAVKSLRDEDKSLARAMGSKTALGKQYASRGAPGLSYWVYEHNLVYPIFKAWAPGHRVLWDERPDASWVQFEAKDRLPPANNNSSKQLVDLQVIVDEKKDERWFFEAHWMNARSGENHATRDASKLQEIGRARRSKRTRLFLFGIWNNFPEKLESDLNWLDENPVSGHGPAYLAVFTSKVARKTGVISDGYHFVAVREVF